MNAKISPLMNAICPSGGAVLTCQTCQLQYDNDAKLGYVFVFFAIHATYHTNDWRSSSYYCLYRHVPSFDCPRSQGLRQQHAEIFQDSHDAMRSLMWHNDQKSVCALLLAIVDVPRQHDRFVLIGL